MKKMLFLLYLIMTCIGITLVGCGNSKITLTGPQRVSVGDTITLEAKTSSNEPIVWRSSNKDIATVSKGVVSGISVGEATIYVSCGKYEASLKIKVLGEEEKVDEVDYFESKARLILDKMTLEQKVGEMFIATVDGSLNSASRNLIKKLAIGNVIYKPNRGFTYQELADEVNNIQSVIRSSNVMPGFIINVKDTASYRLLDSLVAMPSSITILASDDEQNAYDVAYTLGSELRSFGFTATLNPNMLLNDEEPYSYLDDPATVAKYTTKEMEGYHYSGVMAIGYTFPGGGENDQSRQHSLGSSLDTLVKEDLLPFVSAFDNGLDALMVGSTILTVFDNTYASTLSYPVVTTVLKQSLNYKGLIISGYLDTNLINNNYRSKEESVAVCAINAGVHMLAYSGVSYLEEDYNAVLNAVKKGTIDEKLIDEAVLKIILKKNKYDILEDNHYAPAWDIAEYDSSAEKELNRKIAKDCIAILNGEVPTLEKTQKILVASPLAMADLGVNSSDEAANSFAYVMAKALEDKGYENVDLRVFDSNDGRQMREINELSNEYDLVIFALDYLSWRRWLSFADNCLFVSLSVPIDISRVEGVICYISAYGYEKENVDAFIDCLLNEAPMKDRRQIEADEE